MPRAKQAFIEMGLLPKYPIYQDWISKVEKYFEATGGSDPYAEGAWFAGELSKSANTPAKQSKLVLLLIRSAKSGKVQSDVEAFRRSLLGEL